MCCGGTGDLYNCFAEFQNQYQHVASICHSSFTFNSPRFAAADFHAVSLGPRILRSEVATVAALAGDHRVGSVLNGHGLALCRIN